MELNLDSNHINYNIEKNKVKILYIFGDSF